MELTLEQFIEHSTEEDSGLSYFQSLYGDDEAGYENFLSDMEILTDKLIGPGDELNCQQNCYIKFNRCMEEMSGGWGGVFCWSNLTSCLRSCPQA